MATSLGVISNWKRPEKALLPLLNCTAPTILGSDRPCYFETLPHPSTILYLHHIVLSNVLPKVSHFLTTLDRIFHRYIAL